jgi:hypothetical protein
VDVLYSGDLVHALSSEAVTLYHHLQPAQPRLGGLLQQVCGLCCNAVGLVNELLARRDYHRRHPLQRVAGWVQKTALMWKLQLAGVLLIVASGLSACASSQNPLGEARGAVNAPDGSAAKRLPGEEGYPEELRLYLAQSLPPLLMYKVRLLDCGSLGTIQSGHVHIQPQS